MGVFPAKTIPLEKSIVETWEGVELPFNSIDSSMFPDCIEFFGKPDHLKIPNYVYLKHMFDLKHKNINLNFHYMKFIPFEEIIGGQFKSFMMVVIIDKPYADQSSRDDSKTASGSVRYIYELTVSEAKKLVICRNYNDACAVLRKILGWGNHLTSNAPSVLPIIGA